MRSSRNKIGKEYSYQSCLYGAWEAVKLPQAFGLAPLTVSQMTHRDCWIVRTRANETRDWTPSQAAIGRPDNTR